MYEQRTPKLNLLSMNCKCQELRRPPEVYLEQENDDQHRDEERRRFEDVEVEVQRLPQDPTEHHAERRLRGEGIFKIDPCCRA